MLELKYKKINPEIQKAMQQALTTSNDYYSEAIKTIQQHYPGNITILNSANSCIFTVLEAVDDTIAVPDMGGWNGVEKSAQILDKKIIKIPTDNAIINPKTLDEFIKQNTDIKTLYITALGAYNKQQSLPEISQICKKHDILLINDISGVMGDKTLTNPEYADIQITSTGTPKIVNIKNGGFINNITQKIKLNTHLIKTLKADNITCAGIKQEIPNAPHTLNKTRKANNYLKQLIKKQLEDNTDYYLIHPEDNKGINTIIKTPSKSKTKKLAYQIRQQLKITQNKNIITTGPNNNRIKKPTINIEIKNLDPDSLTKENIEKLAMIITETIKQQQEEEENID
ncbi:PLP-dependent aminotransferase family protein [Methanosphaera cuniculi]|uniref:DegT/DnrJ/EryC1/StrS aminotransferase family protein n=1 Tax=Methanosphaera cuniculi TaxID=1077256 RepID=A0A2A2HD08_9EURY|nr:hypothetical protein [Methanosphaera cuniculi]PAV07200.1 hypothetical protein ASJ82_05880 [Methanosphaera cuniculi]PWL08508.1 hypothetical protein MSCUN_05870 [Methanosphaera cuniculi]